MIEADPENCVIDNIVRLMAGRWKFPIMHRLFQGPCRFNALQRKLGPITHRTLARQLNELVAAGIVERRDFKTVPPHVEYRVTNLGQSFLPVLKVMHEWAVEHASELQLDQ